MSNRRTILCLTPGDPYGIGPEITVKFLYYHLSHYPEIGFRVIGARSALEESASLLGLPLPQSPAITYVDIPGIQPGMVAYQAIETAVSDIVEGRANALVTGPIAKNHLQDAGIIGTGHTEILEVLARKHYPHLKSKAEMLFLYRGFRLLLLTRHIPLSRVSTELRATSPAHALTQLYTFLHHTLGIAHPRIALLGVNPHAGEVGGVEETLVLKPLMDQFHEATTAQLEGPFAADAFFRGFDANHPPYDAVVATYHDQGLIPFKLLAGYRAVNVTIGLPFIRTSVGHGTAFDIAGQGRATETSLTEAVNVALDLVKARKLTLTPHP